MKNFTKEKYLKVIESSKELRELTAKKLELMAKMEKAFHHEALKQGFITEKEAYMLGLISTDAAYRKGIITHKEWLRGDRK